jgi:alpha-ketoglutarate-dependent taurine dioxygenase
MNTQSIVVNNLALEDLQVVSGLPLILNVDPGGVGALAWAEANCSEIQQLLATNGALVIRGLRLLGSEQFGQILTTLFGAPLLDYVYRSTPRTGLRGNVFTATEYPANEVIPQHNENAYSRTWPLRIGFFCMLAPKEAGATPIGSSREVYKMIPRDVREKFKEKGILYVRNYSNLDLPWSVVFQTEDRTAVEKFCADNELSCEWIGDTGLRTSQRNPAVATHPVTKEELWFNQAHLFHVSSLKPDVAQTLIDSLGEQSLPRNSYYGDGSPIEPQVLEIIRDAYERTKIRFAWQKNDLLLLDNMLFTHGRDSYVGPRKVLTGMAIPNK